MRCPTANVREIVVQAVLGTGWRRSYRLIRHGSAQARFMPWVVLFKHGGHSPLELASGAADGLMGIAGAVLHHHGVSSYDPGFERALNFIWRWFGMAVFVRQMRLNTSNAFAKTVKRFLDHRTEVLGHLVAPVNIRVGIQ